MFTMPLAMVGVLVGLYLAGVTFSVVSIIGIIVLAGIVVNNGIVLVDYINRIREKGVDKMEAVVEAGRVRLPPVLMTALTTILGLVPLTFIPGAGAELEQPLGIAVMGGLLSATPLTLIFIPVVYTLTDRK